MSSFSKVIALAALICTLAPSATAHSWIEEYQVINANGSYCGARGYSRGYVPRTDPTFTGNSDMWMLPSLEARNDDGTARTRINSTDSLCHPSQRTPTYTSAYPKLKVSPGDYVAMKYLENGHVTLPWNITGKPFGGGTIFVFGTTQPSDDEKIADVMKWNTEGTGGNKKGFLMTAQNYDDGRCHQLNCGDISQERQRLEPNHVADQPTSGVEDWCETDLKIPETVKPGSLTTYWVWQWPTNPNEDCNTPAGKDEYYTTCADFDVVADNSAAEAPFSVGAGGNPRSVAVSNYKSRTAYTVSPTAVLQEHNTVVGGSMPTVNPAFVSACSVQASVIKAGNLGVWPEVYVPNSCDVPTSFGTPAASAWKDSVKSAYASYTAGSSSAYSSAFAAAGIPVPSRTPWNAQASRTGTQVQPTAAPNASPAPTGSGNAPAPSAPVATAPYANSTSPAGSEAPAVQVTTITTVLVITSTLPAGQPVPSASAYASAPSSETPSTFATAPAGVSPSSYEGSLPMPATTPIASASAPAPAPADTNGIPTISTKAASASNYRRHARDVRR